MKKLLRRKFATIFFISYTLSTVVIANKLLKLKKSVRKDKMLHHVLVLSSSVPVFADAHNIYTH